MFSTKLDFSKLKHVKLNFSNKNGSNVISPVFSKTLKKKPGGKGGRGEGKDLFLPIV